MMLTLSFFRVFAFTGKDYFYQYTLFLPEEYPYRHATELEMAAELILKEISVALPNGIRVVRIKGEGRHRRRHLRDILDAHCIAPHEWWRVMGNLLQHNFIELRGSDTALAVLE